MGNDVERFDLWAAVRYGAWDIGWATKKQWPSKRQFGFFAIYHDGMHASFHLGPFYVSVFY